MAASEAWRDGAYFFTWADEPMTSDALAERYRNWIDTYGLFYPDITTADPTAGSAFYQLLGFREEMNLGWVVNLVSPSNPTAQVILITKDAAAPPHLILQAVQPPPTRPRPVRTCRPGAVGHRTIRTVIRTGGRGAW